MTKLPSFCFQSKYYDHILVNRCNCRCYNCGQEKDLNCEVCHGQSFSQDEIP